MRSALLVTGIPSIGALGGAMVVDIRVFPPASGGALPPVWPSCAQMRGHGGQHSSPSCRATVPVYTRQKEGWRYAQRLSPGVHRRQSGASGAVPSCEKASLREELAGGHRGAQVALCGLGEGRKRLGNFIARKDQTVICGEAHCLACLQSL